MQRDFFAQQVCLVTGGAQGIGWATGQALADHGAQVYICDVADEQLAQAAQALPKLPWGKRITLTHCDVSQRAEVEAWIADIYRQTGRIDVLVNNAAFVSWKDIADTTVEEAAKTMAVGYNGMVYTTKAVLPCMLAAGRGHIVNMGSIAGRVYVGGPSADYSAVKAALEGYTRILQLELHGTPVSATLVRLTTVAGTDFFRVRVPMSRMPRFADFVPALTPPQVARGILHAIQHRRRTLNMRGFIPLFHLIYDLAPGPLDRIVRFGGKARINYGDYEWHYEPNQ